MMCMSIVLSLKNHASFLFFGLVNVLIAWLFDKNSFCMNKFKYRSRQRCHRRRLGDVSVCFGRILDKELRRRFF
jgi:hypothetical protein